MAELQHPNMFAAYTQGYEVADKMRTARRAEQERNELQSLAGGVMQGDPEAYIRANILDPDKAGKWDEAHARMFYRAGKAAEYVMDAVQRGNQQEIEGRMRQVSPFLSRLTGKPAPERFDPSMVPHMERLIQQGQMLAGQFGSGGTVQSSKIDKDGNIWNIMRDGTMVNTGVKADRQMWLRDHPGMPPHLVDKDAQTYMVGEGAPQGAPQGQPYQQPRAQTTFTGPDGVPVQIDPSLPPEVQAAISANPQGWAQAPDMSQAQIGPQAPIPSQAGIPAQPQASVPGTFRRPSAAEDAAASERAERTVGLEFAEAEARAEAERQRKIKLAEQSVERIPPPVLTILREAEEKASTAEGIIKRMDKHRDKIRSGELRFGPLSNVLAKGQNLAGASTEQSRNYQLFVSDLEKMRNDSLRLNNGVQTEGDAQRAWNELFANLNDTQYVLAGLERIEEINRNAAEIHRRAADEIRQSYPSQQGGQPSGGQRLRYNPATGRIE